MIVTVTPKGQFNVLNVRVTDADRSHRRYLKYPGDDFIGEPQKVLEARDEYHTPEILASYQAWEAEQESLFAPTGPRRIGKPREFLHLFTDAEKAAFFTAKQSDVQLELWWAEASTGDFSLDHPTVALGLAGLVQAGILTQARADQIAGADFNAA